MYWFQVDKVVFNLDKNVILWIVYIPPVNSRYASEDAYYDIDLEFQRFFQQTDYIVLAGAFNRHNSRTGN